MIIMSERRVRHSVAHWCFELTEPWKWDIEIMCREAVAAGCTSVELVGPDKWDVLRKHGLRCAITLADTPGLFVHGLCNQADHDAVIQATKKRIDDCAASNGLCNDVIAFTGYEYRNADNPTSDVIPDDEAFYSCVEGLKILAAHAEARGVRIHLEHLNNKLHIGPNGKHHPMMGHPGYWGCDLNKVARIVRCVHSPSVLLLFDIFHVQVMHGDVIRHIRDYSDIIGHIHTAGNPGRGELHLANEIHYPSVIQALIDVGYTGYVGHEFIPTTDPSDGLKKAVALCDV